MDQYTAYGVFCFFMLIYLLSKHKRKPKQKYVGIHPLSDQKHSNEHYTLARERFQQQDYDSALEAIHTAIELEPEQVSYYYLRGVMFLELKEYDLALSDAEQMITLNDNYFEGYYVRGLGNYILEKYEASLSDFEQVLVIDADTWQANMYVGLIYIHLENEVASNAIFKRLLDEHPDKAFVIHRQLTRRFYLEKKYQRAIHHAESTIARLDDTNPEYQATLLNLLITIGWSQYNLKDAESTLTTAQRIEAVETGSLQIGLLKGHAYHLSHQHHEVIDVCEQYLTDFPDNSHLLYIYSHSLLVVNDLEKALVVAENSVRVDPSHNTYNIQGLVELHLHQFEASEASFTQAITLDPDKEYAYINRASVHTIQGNFETASVDIDYAIALDSGTPSGYLGQARLFLAQANFDEALEASNKALEIDATTEIYLNQALCHIALADYEQSIKALQSASKEMKYDSGAIDYVSAIASETQGNEDDALTYWQSAVSKNERLKDWDWIETGSYYPTELMDLLKQVHERYQAAQGD